MNAHPRRETIMTAIGAHPDAAAVYALGSNAAESARLRGQSEELRPETAELLDHIGLQPGSSAIDLGCGPSGIIDLLAAAVAPGGRVVGLDADPVHVAMARQYAAERGWPTSTWWSATPGTLACRQIPSTSCTPALSW
jgi:predicted O-methyltransferase YrrM